MGGYKGYFTVSSATVKEVIITAIFFCCLLVSLEFSKLEMFNCRVIYSLMRLSRIFQMAGLSNFIWEVPEPDLILTTGVIGQGASL